MERKGLQVIKDVASKTAGLVFFSLLAIALGVVFGVMFERWVGGDAPASTSLDDTPIEDVTTSPGSDTQTPVDVVGADNTQLAPVPVATSAAKYRVKVGPYADIAAAAKAADELRAAGYPVLLAKTAPYLVQVGAFANKDNALLLKTQLAEKGYKAAIQPE